MFMRAQHQIKWSSHALLSLSTAFYRLPTPMHLSAMAILGHPGGKRRARQGNRYHPAVIPFSYERRLPHQAKSLLQRLMDLLR